jgi:ElaB/YqjD/DUF883 family membrane-anchored ribosome-binding protein
MAGFKRSKLLGVLVVSLFVVLTACSSGSDSESSASSALDEAAEGASDAVDSAGQAVSDAADAVTDAADAVTAESDDSSDSVPGWVWALIAAIGVLAIVGVVLGFQNRGKSKQADANQQYNPPPQ